MRSAATLILAGWCVCAQTIPIPVGPVPHISIPAMDSRAMFPVVTSTISPDGKVHRASNLYVLGSGEAGVRRLTDLQNYGATWVSVSPDGSKAAYNTTVSGQPGNEEIHVVDLSSGEDQKIAVDKIGCAQPLGTGCTGCFLSCIRSVHFTPDGSKVVYSASEAQPLFVVNADGSGVLHLPIEGAVLAPSPRRVVSRSGRLLFTKADGVYTAGLDGSDIEKLADAPEGLIISNATISEDGGTIAFEAQPLANTGRPVSQIFILRQGADPMALTGDSGYAISASLSADGSRIAFVQDGQAYIGLTDGSRPPAALTSFKYVAANSVTLSGDGGTALVRAGAAIYAARNGGAAARLYAPAVIVANGITSLSGLAQPSPGSLFRISGLNFADDNRFSSGVPLTAALGGVSVKASGEAVPLLSVSPSEIEAQLPFSTAAGDTSFTVHFEHGPELKANTTVAEAAPEVLQYVLPSSTSAYAMAFHAGTRIPADQAHPAAEGEALEMYGLGLGPVSPAVDAGLPAPVNPPAQAINMPQVTIGKQAAAVTFAGLAPGEVGVYQVNAVVPAGLTSGSQRVSWAASGQPATVTWSIWVQ